MGKKPPLSGDELEKAILGELEKRTGWDKIAHKYHVSSKTIAGIRAKHQGTPNSPGEVAARAFEAFNRGWKPVRVVIELKQPVEVIEGLYEKWAELKDYWLIRGATKEELADDIDSRTSYSALTLTGFVHVVHSLVDDHVARNGFRYYCDVCGGPLIADPDTEWKWLIDNEVLKTWGHRSCHGKE